MQKNSNLQDVYLTNVSKNQLNVTMFLMNGYQLRGVITGFDAFTVVLNSDGPPSPPLWRNVRWI